MGEIKDYTPDITKLLDIYASMATSFLTDYDECTLPIRYYIIIVEAAVKVILIFIRIMWYKGSTALTRNNDLRKGSSEIEYMLKSKGYALVLLLNHNTADSPIWIHLIIQVRILASERP